MASSEVHSAPLLPPAAAVGVPRETQSVDTTEIEDVEPEKAANEPENAEVEPEKAEAEPEKAGEEPEKAQGEQEKAKAEPERAETDDIGEVEPGKANVEPQIAATEPGNVESELENIETELKDGETPSQGMDVEVPIGMDVGPQIVEDDVAASIQLEDVDNVDAPMDAPVDNVENVDAPRKHDDAIAPTSAQLESGKDESAVITQPADLAASPHAPEQKKIKPKGTSKPASHPSYSKMISEAIIALQEKSGSSQHAIAKSIEEKHKSSLTPNFRKVLSIQLKRLSQNGQLVKVKNSYKLSSKAKKGKKAKRVGKPTAIQPSTKQAGPSKPKSKSPTKTVDKKRKASTTVEPRAKKPKSQSIRPLGRKQGKPQSSTLTEKAMARKTKNPKASKALTEKATASNTGKLRARKVAEPPTSSKEAKPKAADKEPSTSKPLSSAPSKASNTGKTRWASKGAKPPPSSKETKPKGADKEPSTSKPSSSAPSKASNTGKTRQATRGAKPPTSSKTKPKAADKEPSTSKPSSSAPSKGGPNKAKASRTSAKPPPRAEAVRTSKRHAAMAAADAKPAVPPAKRAKRTSK